VALVLPPPLLLQVQPRWYRPQVALYRLAVPRLLALTPLLRRPPRLSQQRCGHMAAAAARHPPPSRQQRAQVQVLAQGQTQGQA